MLDPPCSDHSQQERPLGMLDPSECKAAYSCFMDGSCYRHEIPELSRAGWAVVFYNSKGALVRGLYGSVPGHLRQTAQAGEYSACAGACVNMYYDTIGYSDCKGVIKAHELPLQRRLSGRRFHSATCRVAATAEGFGFSKDLVKVKAHQVWEDMVTEHDKFLFLGNEAADKFAKAGANLHCLDTKVIKEADWLLKEARMVAALIVKFFDLWPASNVAQQKGKRKQRLLKRPSAEPALKVHGNASAGPSQGPLSVQHQNRNAFCDWFFVNKRWYCRDCFFL